MIFVAIGANLPGPDGSPPLRTCQAAAHALRELPGLRLTNISRWYQSTPVPPSGQPDYINGVASLARLAGTQIAPEALLAALQAIEARFGRRRSERNAPRTLDLDLIDMDGMVRGSPDPMLPHPRAHLRAFVLMPLLDVAPDWVHPVTGETARALLDLVDGTGVAPIDDHPGPCAISGSDAGRR